jgi:hypothetical protein
MSARSRSQRTDEPPRTDGHLMNRLESNPRKNASRVVTGFHRLGLLLSAPLLLAAVVVAVFAFVSKDGPVVADGAATESALRIVLANQASQNVNEMTNEEQIAAVGRALVSQGAPSIATIEVDTGPIRTFDFYWAFPKKTGQDSLDEKTTTAVLRAIASLERRRGAVISAGEQPIRVGDVMVRESSARQRPFNDWTHLKRGFNWEIAAWAAGLAGFAFLIYILARALGWVMDGFISKPEN